MRPNAANFRSHWGIGIPVFGLSFSPNAEEARFLAEATVLETADGVAVGSRFVVGGMAPPKTAYSFFLDPSAALVVDWYRVTFERIPSGTDVSEFVPTRQGNPSFWFSQRSVATPVSVAWCDDGGFVTLEMSASAALPVVRDAFAIVADGRACEIVVGPGDPARNMDQFDFACHLGVRETVSVELRNLPATPPAVAPTGFRGETALTVRITREMASTDWRGVEGGRGCHVFYLVP